MLLIRDLAEGSARFCELERSLEGISPRTLSLRLRALEEEGIVERHTYPEVPPRVEYALTEKGKALVPLVEDMRSYGSAGCWTTRPSRAPAPSSRSAARRRAGAGGPACGRKPGACVISSSTRRSAPGRRGRDAVQRAGRQRRADPFDVAADERRRLALLQLRAADRPLRRERERELRSLPGFAPAREAVVDAGVAAPYLEARGEQVPADPGERAAQMLTVFFAALWDGCTGFSLDRERPRAARSPARRREPRRRRGRRR